jgi:hypothetical protein
LVPFSNQVRLRDQINKRATIQFNSSIVAGIIHFLTLECELMHIRDQIAFVKITSLKEKGESFPCHKISGNKISNSTFDSSEIQIGELVVVDIKYVVSNSPSIQFKGRFFQI